LKKLNRPEIGAPKPEPKTGRGTPQYINVEKNDVMGKNKQEGHRTDNDRRLENGREIGTTLSQPNNKKKKKKGGKEKREMHSTITPTFERHVLGRSVGCRTCHRQKRQTRGAPS